MTADTPTTTPRPNRTRTRALAVVGAVLASVLVWIVSLLLGLELRIDPNNGQPAGVIGLPVIAGFSLVSGLLGWGLLALLERFTARAALIWTIVAVVVLVLSMAPFLTITAAVSTSVTLALMHVAVAAVLIPLLPRWSARR